MLRWAIIFFLVAIIAAVFGFSGISRESTHIGTFLALVGIILAIGFLFLHWRSKRDR